MSYGVNRAKRTTRRKKRRPSSGRARAAGTRKSRATSTRRGTSARSARRKSARKPAKRTTRKRTTSKSSRSRKARLYTRYDPETGQKVRVPAGSFEYVNWVSRKPSKKKQMRAALKSDPLGTIGVVGLAAGTRAAEKIAERTVRAGIRRYGVAGAAAAAEGAAALGYGSVALAALPIAAAIGGALLYYSTQPGAEENKLSVQFVAAQKTLMQQTHAATWGDVPEAARTRLLNDYKSGLKRIAEVRRATSLQTSNRYRKG